MSHTLLCLFATRSGLLRANPRRDRRAAISLLIIAGILVVGSIVRITQQQLRVYAPDTHLSGGDVSHVQHPAVGVSAAAAAPPPPLDAAAPAAAALPSVPLYYKMGGKSDEEASKQWAATLAWRREERVNSILDEAPEWDFETVNKHMSTGYIHGRDFQV